MALKHFIVTVIIISLANFAASERVLGAYIFQQHGDRTVKFQPPVVLTDQGDHEQYLTGRYFHDRYISPSSNYRIWGIGLDTHNSLKELDCFTDAQVAAESPNQGMILQSGKAFLRGLYPLVPAENQLNEISNAHHNGDFEDNSARKSLAHVVDSSHPLAIKTFQVDDQPDSYWDPNRDDCSQAYLDMHEYTHSARYQSLIDASKEFYQSLAPIMKTTSYHIELSYDNGYQIWDIFNSDLIHRPHIGSRFASANLSSEVVMQELSRLATTERSGWLDGPGPNIGGWMLTGKVLSELNKMTNKKTHERLHIQFGSPDLLISFSRVNGGAPPASLGSYSSTMIWELVTDVPGNEFPSKKDIFVRFLAHEGPIISNTTSLTVHPLLQLSTLNVTWNDFDRLSKDFGITSFRKWCDKCNMDSDKGICEDKFSTTYIYVIFISLFLSPLVVLLVVILVKTCVICFKGCKDRFKATKRRMQARGSSSDTALEGLRRLCQGTTERMEVVVDYMGSGIKLFGAWILFPPKGIFNMAVALAKWVFNKENKQKNKSNNSGDAGVWSVEMVEGANSANRTKEGTSPV